MSELCALIIRHCHRDITPTAVPRLTLSRSSVTTELSPVMYYPLLCVVARGRKRIYLGHEEFRYDPNSYLVASIDLPVSGQVIEAPCLGVTLALDPATQTHRFRVRKERRQHLHQQIDRHRLDVTHVTERTGSPQTLVCSKTRATYERQCRQYNEDLASMAALRPLIGETDGDVQTVRARMDAARQRRARYDRRQP